MRRNASLRGSTAVSGSASIELEDLGRPDESGLDDLGVSGDQLVARERVEQVEVAHHGAGRPERSDEVLALGRVHARLAADGRVDHAEHGRRHLHDLDAAQPGRRHEAGEVGDRSPAEADHGVGAGEVGLAHHLPAERGDLDPLALLGIRDLGEEHLAVADERGAQLLGLRRERRRVHDEHLAGCGRQRFAEGRQDAVAHRDVVARVAAHRDRRRVGHFGSVRSLSASHASSCRSVRSAHATISSTTSWSGPLEVSMVRSASSS